MGVTRALHASMVACNAIREGTVQALEPIEPCAVGGWKVHTRDGRDQTFAGVVLVSSPPQLPWLDRGLFDWEDGQPALVGGLLAPGLANLYLLALGGSPVRSDSLRLLVAMICAQARLNHPFVDELVRVVTPRHSSPAGWATRRLERRAQRYLLRPADAGSWRAIADYLDGPLTGARGT